MATERLFLVGFMASGKSTTGRRIARKYGYDFIDLDAYIEKRYFKTIAQIFAEKGEDGFRQIESSLLDEVMGFEHVIVACGGGTPCFFDNMERMNKAGVTVYLNASAVDLCQYLKQSGLNKRPLVKDKSDEELLLYVQSSLQKRAPYYEKALYTVASDDLSDTLFEKLLKKEEN